jgi:DNA polymerase-3 subunit epsilon
MMFGLLKGMRKLPPGVDPRTPITSVPYVVLDTELTGLDETKDSIISVGAVRMHGGKINLGETFYRLVSPKTQFSAESVVIHEIMPSEVIEKPDIDTVLKEFLDFCGHDVLVGHFISIDLGFINREMKRIYREEMKASALDTFSMYEWLRKRQKCRDCFATPLTGYRLYDIVKCFSIPVNGAHNALMDAFTTAELFQRFIPLILEAGANDIGDLIKLGTPFKGGDRFRLSGEFSNF